MTAMPQSVTVRVPATSANLGPGFDCLGLALDLWAAITVSLGGAAGERRLEPMAQMALGAARAVLEKSGQSLRGNLSALYEGDIPIARGLGASAVARVGGALAANALAGGPLDADGLLAVGTALEGHADNVAPALFGGLQVSVAAGDRVLHTRAALPDRLSAVLFVPELRMPTRESRRLLPKSLSRADAVHNIGRAALLVAALAQGRFDLLDTATDDRLHQPARSTLFPAMYAIFAAAKTAGAHCAYLSGGGSTVCALATENEDGIADSMREAARTRETPGYTIITRPTEKGAEVVG
jgi:homoserine kinase